MPDMKLKSVYFLPVFFAVTVTAVHLFLLSTLKGKTQKFVTGFMGASVFKFFIYGVVLVLLLFYSNENKQVLILHFIFYYLAFTILEVIMLYSVLKKMK